MAESAESNQLLLVKAEALPVTLRKTLQAKEYLKKGICKTVNDAVKKVGISRAAYYKYKDYVFSFTQLSRGKIVTLAFLLEHEPGVLSKILTFIAKVRGNVLTINQGIPLQGIANVSISIETQDMDEDIDALLSELRACEGVKKIDIIGQGW